MALGEQTLRPYYWRATNLFPEKEIATRIGEDVHHYTYGDFGDRVPALANALSEFDVGSDATVGTFAWNHYRHLEAYYAVPMMGWTLHTINTQLPDSHVEHIVEDSADDVLLVDSGDPFETVERVWDDLDGIEAVVVFAEGTPETSLDCVYAHEELIQRGDSTRTWPQLSGDRVAGMCYTSGTTGMPKGVQYTHEMIFTHAMMATTPVTMDIDESDVMMPVVPMFHVNGWELPYAMAVAGAKQVYPGKSPTTADVARLIEEEGVTMTAGVPTVWINLLEYLEDHDTDVSSLERIITGGSAVPKAVMRQYKQEYDVTIDHAWGMTETMSIGSLSRPKSWMASWDEDEKLDIREKQGILSPGLEMRVVDDDGNEVPWDGETFGELYVRGPTVIDSYYNRPDATEEDFVEETLEGEDGEEIRRKWLKTGDIVTIDENGYMEVVDRRNDVIKSGGEWISSIELENKLMEHDAIAEAAVVGVPNDRWQERPVACVVTRAEDEASDEELRDSLGEAFPRWWLPDNIVHVDEIPKTSTGKFDKKVLREKHKDVGLPWVPGSS